MRFSWSRWTIPLVLSLGVVCLTGLPQLADAALVTTLAGALLLVVTGGWYWDQPTRVQPEALPKLRLAAAAVSVVLLSLMYDLLVGALGLPAGLAGLLFAGLLGATAAALVVTLAAVIDMALLNRLRWSRVVAAGLVVGLGLYLAISGYRFETGRELLGVVTPTSAPFPLVVLVVVLALQAPMEWIVVLDTRQRLAVLAGWLTALVPLTAAIWVGRLVPLPRHAVLVEYARVTAIVCLVYLVVVLARVMLTLPGTRAYERKVRELDAIYDFGLTAGAAFNRAELQAAILDSMMRVAEPDVAVVVEPERAGAGCSCVLLRADNAGEHLYRFHSRASWSALAERFADRRPVVIVDHRKAAPGALERIWEPATGSSVILPVFSQDGRARAILIAGRFETYAFNAAEVRSLAGFANQVALAMDHARLLRETVEAERQKRELEIARELQMNLLPKDPPALPGLDIAARSEPATEVGGDYFDYLTLHNDKLGIVVGDVAGHGMPAGLLMAIAKSAIHTQAQSDSPPLVLMERLSKTLLQMSADNQFMTLVLAVLDPETLDFSYSNAGHHYPIHYRAATGSIEYLESTGIPLGMLPRPPGDFRDRQLGRGDVLVFYSDGLVEAGAERDDMFGGTRLGEVVLANRGRSANTIVEAVFRAVRQFSGDEPLHDDATIVVLRVLEERPLTEANDVPSDDA